MINSPSYNALPDNIDIDSPYAMPLLFNYLLINNGMIAGSTLGGDVAVNTAEFSIYETSDTLLATPLLNSPYTYAGYSGPVYQFWIDDIADLPIGTYYYRLLFTYSDGKFPELKACGKLTITTKGSTLKRFGDISRGTYWND